MIRFVGNSNYVSGSAPAQAAAAAAPSLLPSLACGAGIGEMGLSHFHMFEECDSMRVL